MAEIETGGITQEEVSQKRDLPSFDLSSERPLSPKPTNLILSIFLGLDLLGRAFEEEGYCVVRGPDVIWGGNIKAFHSPGGVFTGVIGGPPCQIFSRLRWLSPQTIGKRHGNLIPEYCRVVKEARPVWWLMENVIEAEEPEVLGYKVQMFTLDNLWFGGIATRRRAFWFGSLNGSKVYPEPVIFQYPNPIKTVVLAGHGPVGRGEGYQKQISIREACLAQGLPENFADDLPFTTHGKRQVIGNGVPMPLGRALARAVKRCERDYCGQ